MPINSTGPISLGGSVLGQSVNLELGRSATASVSINDTAVRGLAGVATGAISFSNFYGRSLSYAIAPNVSSVNEGGSVTFTVTTTGLLNGTVLFWSTNLITGTINTADFTDTVLSGTVTINSNTGSVTRTLTNDVTTEGAESFQLQLRTGSTSGTVVATSATVTINDTSINLPGQIVFEAGAPHSGGIEGDITTYNWTVPAGVTSISVVCVGGGGGGRSFGTNSSFAGGGGGGGALAYRNNITVTPGQILRIDAGKGSTGRQTADSGSNLSAFPGGSTWVYSSTGPAIPITQAEGGRGGGRSGSAAGGRSGFSQGAVTFTGGAGGATATTGFRAPSGGGGAAGYAGAGGNGGNRIQSTAVNGASGTGGAGGGGGAFGGTSAQNGQAGHGGGVGLLGQGTNGAGGTIGTTGAVTNGGPGSGGGGGNVNLKRYGAGAGGGINGINLFGGPGAARIMWPGNLRSYPNTRTANE